MSHFSFGVWYILGRNFFYQFHPQGFLKMADDRTGSVREVSSRLLSQSIAIDERFLCGYRLVIDWPIPIDTNLLILSIDIDWSVEFPIIGFHRLDTPGFVQFSLDSFTFLWTDLLVCPLLSKTLLTSHSGWTLDSDHMCWSQSKQEFYTVHCIISNSMQPEERSVTRQYEYTSMEDSSVTLLFYNIHHLEITCNSDCSYDRIVWVSWSSTMELWILEWATKQKAFWWP